MPPVSLLRHRVVGVPSLLRPWTLSRDTLEREMGQSSAALSLILFFLSGLALALGERLSAKECENLGFTGLALCSDCNTFAEYVKDEGIDLPDRYSSLSLSLVWNPVERASWLVEFIVEM